MSVLAQIRAATRHCHDELETGADIVARLTCTAGRPALLATFHRLYANGEAALAPHLLPLRDLDFERRRKAPALLAGLQSLGSDGAAGRLAGKGAGPAFADAAEALGFAYVLEGATLGGRIVRRQVAQASASLDGLDFFDFYGADTGPRWQQFCRVLERECAADATAAVAGASAGFAYMADGLLPPGGPSARQANAMPG